MSTIVTRSGKGSELTFVEMDANFTNLNTDKIQLTNLSVTDSGGDGSLAYNNSTGVITYTGPSASDVRAHFSAGEGIDIASGVVSGEDATVSNKGIASFATANFSVTSGAVSVKADGINDTHLDFGTGTNQISTADIPEATNLFYTAERVDDQVNTLMTAGSNITLTYDDAAGTLTVAASGTATTINNNADNRIITGSGTANTLEGESTLLYSGTSLSNTTAPTFTAASTPIQFNGTQPNQGGYNVYKSINTGTTRGGQGYRSATTGGGAKVDTHTLFFDLDDDYGLRPASSYQGDRNFYLQANHTADALSIYMDGFSTNTIESFDGNNDSYARTAIELHGSTTTLKAGGTAALTATSSLLTTGVDLDTNSNDIKLGGGTLDLENGDITSTGGSIAFTAPMSTTIDTDNVFSTTIVNEHDTGDGLQVTVGTPGAYHTSGELFEVRRATDSGYTSLIKAESTGTGQGAGVVSFNNIDGLFDQDVVDTSSGTFAINQYMEIVVNGNQRYIPLYTRS
jgi:hypothetical protein